MYIDNPKIPIMTKAISKFGMKEFDVALRELVSQVQLDGYRIIDIKYASSDNCFSAILIVQSLT